MDVSDSPPVHAITPASVTGEGGGPVPGTMKPAAEDVFESKVVLLSVGPGSSEEGHSMTLPTLMRFEVVDANMQMGPAAENPIQALERERPAHAPPYLRRLVHALHFWVRLWA